MEGVGRFYNFSKSFLNQSLISEDTDTWQTERSSTRDDEICLQSWGFHEDKMNSKVPVGRMNDTELEYKALLDSFLFFSKRKHLSTTTM